MNARDFPLEIRFFIDPESGEPHIHNHGVDEEEVMDVLENRAELLPRGFCGARCQPNSDWANRVGPFFENHLRSTTRRRRPVRGDSVRCDRKGAYRLPATEEKV